MQLVNNLIDATKEIFTSMVMMKIVPGDPLPAVNGSTDTVITGMVGLAGAFKGMLAIHLPAQVAKTITGNFLGMEVEEVDEDVQDAIGEVANMLGGSVKAMLSESGGNIELSLPSTVCGKNYSLKHKEDTDLTIIPFSTTDGDFLVELQLQKTA